MDLDEDAEERGLELAGELQGPLLQPLLHLQLELHVDVFADLQDVVDRMPEEDREFCVPLVVADEVRVVGHGLAGIAGQGLATRAGHGAGLKEREIINYSVLSLIMSLRLDFTQRKRSLQSDVRCSSDSSLLQLLQKGGTVGAATNCCCCCLPATTIEGRACAVPCARQRWPPRGQGTCSTWPRPRWGRPS